MFICGVAIATAGPGGVSAAMEPPPPLSRCSEAAAAAAREHLRGVEQQLQNEGLVFDKGTVQHLEDATEAINELEEERKHILELLEEETIRNCNLRVRVKGLPEKVMQEFEALVAAARRSRFSQIKELEASLREMASALEQTYRKQRLAEQRNRVLCDEQRELGGKHQEAADRLNRQMAARHSVCIRINEFRNMQKDTEEEIAWEMEAIRALEEQMAGEVSAFKEQQRLLESQTAELQSQLQARRHQTSQKRIDYEALLVVLQALREQVEEKSQAILAGRGELAKLFEMIKNLLKEYEDKKAEKEKILLKKAELRNMTGLDPSYLEKKTAVLQQLAEAEKEIQKATQARKKLRSENDFLRTQYEALVEEERQLSSRRNQLAKEFEKLSNQVTEKLDYLTKRLVEIQNVEEEQQKMQDLLEEAENSYMSGLESLDLTLQREGDRSNVLHDQLDTIFGRLKDVQSSHMESMDSMHSKMETGQQALSNLMRQNEALEKERSRSDSYIKILTDKWHQETTEFEKFNSSITAELEKLEDEYNSKLKLLQEKEEKLGVDLLFSEKLQMELNEASIACDGQKNLCFELCEEETTLSKSIAHSLQETARLRRLKTRLRSEINGGREAANQQLHALSESLKFLERDNYEVNRKLYIVNAENARFREAIAHLRAEISTMESEEETYRSKRQQAQEETRAVHDIFDKIWSWDKHLWQVFLLGELKVLKDLEEQVERFKKRNKKVNYVSNGLQLNYEGMVSLIKSKPSIEGKSPATSPNIE